MILIHHSQIKFQLPLLLVAALLLASCHSSKNATTSSGTDLTGLPAQQRLETLVAQVSQQRQTATGLRAKMNLRLSLGSRSATLGGTLRMKRDEAIQLSLTALGLLEVGRLELTPDYFLIQDRVHKQYLRMAWSDLPAFQEAGVNFSVLQALLWAQLFVPGQTAAPAARDFTLSETPPGAPRLTTDFRRPLVADFVLQAPSAAQGGEHSLTQTSVSAPARSDLALRCQYGEWTQLTTGPFPSDFALTVQAAGRTITADIALSRLQADDKMADLITQPGSSYRQVTLDELLKALKNGL